MSREIGWVEVEISNIGFREGKTGKVLALTFEPLDHSEKYFIGLGPRSPIWQELISAVFSHTEIITMGLDTADIWDVGLLMFEKKVCGLLMHGVQSSWQVDPARTFERYWFKHFKALERTP